MDPHNLQSLLFAEQMRRAGVDSRPLANPAFGGEHESLAFDPDQLVVTCSECGRPLKTKTDEAGDLVSFEHALQDIPCEEFEAVIQPASSAETLVCDFCNDPKPQWVFVPQGHLGMLNPIEGSLDNFSSPWSACSVCKDLVLDRNVDGTVQRALKNGIEKGMYAGLNRQQQRQVRIQLKDLHWKFHQTNPTGPFKYRD